MEEKESAEHILQLRTWHPVVEAVCSCGVWSFIEIGRGYLTEEEARLEAANSHASHLEQVEGSK